MRGYLIRRVLLLIPTIFLVSALVFLVVRLLPGDVVDMIIREVGSGGAGGPSPEVIERALGLDVPIHVQYGRWISDIFLHGSLGTSLRSMEPITPRILARIGTTAELGLLAIIIGLVIALPIGIYSAIRQDTIGDYIARSFAIIFISVPSFWTGTLVMLYPSIWWGWSPPMEVIAFSVDPLGNLGVFIIPAFILGMLLSGTTMRMTRTMVLEVLRQDYIRTAWSKGLNEKGVIIRHALKNALIPVVTIVGMQLPILVGGSVILEQIFVLPGIGRLLINALTTRDYTVVSGINMVVASAIMVANLLVDMSYAYLDPRLRYR